MQHDRSDSSLQCRSHQRWTVTEDPTHEHKRHGLSGFTVSRGCVVGDVQQGEAVSTIKLNSSSILIRVLTDGLLNVE